jgi:hypothetical protein
MVSKITSSRKCDSCRLNEVGGCLFRDKWLNAQRRTMVTNPKAITAGADFFPPCPRTFVRLIVAMLYDNEAPLACAGKT